MKATVFIHQDQPDRNGSQVDIEGLLLPEIVPVLQDFDGPQIGMARLKREGDRIIADISVANIPRVRTWPAIGFGAIRALLKPGVLLSQLRRQSF